MTGLADARQTWEFHKMHSGNIPFRLNWYAFLHSNAGTILIRNIDEWIARI